MKNDPIALIDKKKRKNTLPFEKSVNIIFDVLIYIKSFLLYCFYLAPSFRNNLNDTRQPNSIINHSVRHRHIWTQLVETRSAFFKLMPSGLCIKRN